MKLTTADVFGQIGEFWKKQNKKTKTILIGGGCGVVALAVLLSAVLNRTDYVNLYNGLDAGEAGEIAARLDEMGVSYKVGSTGAIQVPKDSEAKLRMTLAAEGYPKTALNYNLFSSNSGFTTSDYEKEKYLIFQLQDRLQDAIETIQGVKNAIVTISLPEDDSFVLEKDKVPATASVVLSLDGGFSLDSRQVRGITALVSKSVPGLEAENVAIIDDMGDVLGSQYDGDAGQAYSRLELEKSISAAMENRLAKLFTPVFGEGGFRVAVNTSVDTSHKVKEQTTYTPVVGDNGIASRMETSRQNEGTGTGTGGVPGTGSNTGPATYPEVTSGSGSANSSESQSADYLVNQLYEQVENNGYEIRDLTVAVMVGQEMTGDQLDEYRQMAAFATGVNPDKIAVTAVRFIGSEPSPEPAPQENGGPFNLSRRQLIILAGACGGVFLLMIALMILWSRKRRKVKRLAAAEQERPGLEEMLSGTAKQKIPGQIVLNETREQALKRQIAEFAGNSPEIVAQLLRTWLKEDGDNGGE